MHIYTKTQLHFHRFILRGIHESLFIYILKYLSFHFGEIILTTFSNTSSQMSDLWTAGHRAEIDLITIIPIHERSCTNIKDHFQTSYHYHSYLVNQTFTGFTLSFKSFLLPWPDLIQHFNHINSAVFLYKLWALSCFLNNYLITFLLT